MCGADDDVAAPSLVGCLHYVASIVYEPGEATPHTIEDLYCYACLPEGTGPDTERVMMGECCDCGARVG